jgi:hypothetical protein
MKKQHSNGSKLWEDMAMDFKEKANGIDIFPKLPSQLKVYFKMWSENQLIRAAQHGVRDKMKELLSVLSGIGQLEAYGLQEYLSAAPAIPQRAEIEMMRVANNLSDDIHLTSRPGEMVPEPHQFIPPIAAPSQRHFVPPTGDGAAAGSRRVNQRRNCYYYTDCEEDARVCGGTGSSACILMGPIATKWDQVEHEAFLERKSRRQTEDKREAKAKQDKMKKQDKA